MSVMFRREEQEREVLASLLLEPSSISGLPKRFDEGAFEFPEYRKLYSSIRNEHNGKSGLRLDDFIRLLPDQRKVIDDVTFAALPLNGKLRSRAQALLSHRPLGDTYPHSEETEVGTHKRANTNSFRFTLLNGQEIAALNIPPKEWLVEGLITAKSVSFLSGEEGCGKSLLAMNLAISVAIGAENWLSYQIVRHGRVLYLNNEMAFDDYARRLKCMGQALPTRGDTSNLVVPTEVPALRECWDTLNETCQELRPCLVVIDCLYFSHDEDENDSSAMKALMRKILALRDSFGLAVLLVHHTKKGSRYTSMHNDQMRGSSVFGGSADSTLQMRRSATEEGKRILKPTKGRHVDDSQLKCRLLSLNPESLWFRDEGVAIEAEHIERTEPTAEEQIDFREIIKPGERVSRKEILGRVKHTGYDERTIDRMLRKAKGTGALKVPQYGYYSL